MVLVPIGKPKIEENTARTTIIPINEDQLLGGSKIFEKIMKNNGLSRIVKIDKTYTVNASDHVTKNPIDIEFTVTRHAQEYVEMLVPKEYILKEGEYNKKDVFLVD